MKKKVYKYNNGGWKSMSSTDKASSILGGVSSILDSTSNGVESKAGNIMGGIGKGLSSIPTPFTQVAGAALQVVGGLTNKMFGTKWNKEFISQTESNITNQTNTTWDALSNSSLLDQWGDFSNLDYVSKNQVGKDGWFSNKVGKKTRQLNSQIDDANYNAFQSFGNAVEAVDALNDFNLAASYAADGGKIHIKKKNRGKFTESAERAGMGVQEFARHILSNKEDYSPTQIKRANFARNASKWKHSLGGNLFSLGGDFSNGITIVDNGGTHEENPFEGVPMGIAPDGSPNLVEEGEVIFNDYVFSNRLKVPKEFSKKYKLGNKDLTFADAAELMQKESEERPNDPISKRGLEDSMARLQQVQEEIRAEKNKNKYANGGHILATGGPAGINPDLYDDDYNIFDTPTGSKIIGNPYAEDFISPIVNSSPTINNTPSVSKQDSSLPWLRYAPVIGSATGVLGSTLLDVDAPDYSLADDVVKARRTVGYTPVTEKLVYNPFDTDYAVNKLNALEGATERAITNSSNDNIGSLIAGLTALGYNTQGRVGDLFRTAQEYNQTQKERVAGFNRQTDAMNSEMEQRAEMANAEAALRAAAIAQQLKQAELQRYRSDKQARLDSIAGNLSNFFDNLGNIGLEEYNREAVRNNPALYYYQDKKGNYHYKGDYYNLSDKDKKAIDKDLKSKNITISK